MLGSVFLLTLACGGSIASRAPGDGGVDVDLVDAGGADVALAAPEASLAADAAGPGTCTTVGSSCGQLPLCGDRVETTVDPGVPPAATGGNVLPGTYVLQSAISYAGSGGATGAGSWAQITIQLTAVGPQSFDWTDALVSNDAGGPISSTGTLTFSGNSYNLQVMCTTGGVAGSPGTYSADTTSITFYLVEQGAAPMGVTYSRL